MTIQEQVDAYLTTHGIRFSSIPTGECVKWGHPKTKWSVALEETEHNLVEFDFYSNHTPTAADVLYCLLSDLSFAEYSLDELMDELSIETIKETMVTQALLTVNAAKLKQVFSQDQIEALQDLLQDY